MCEMKINVLQLWVSPYQNDKRLVEQITLDMDGIKDDYHYQKDSLITLLPLEAWQSISKDPNALCARRFYAHMLSSEYDNEELLLDTCLENASVLLQVVSVGKPCHKDDGCKYHYSDEGCPLMRKTRFLRVLSGGTLSVGDRLEVTSCLNMP